MVLCFCSSNRLYVLIILVSSLTKPCAGLPPGGRKTIEGDIVGESIRTLKQAGEKDATKTREKLLWPNATVPYDLFPGYSEWQTKQILTAIKGFDDTCVRFIPRTTEENYIFIAPGARECSAEVGHKGQGVQIIALVSDCIEQLGTIQHELMHTLGFFHEQARNDRDNYIEISWDHIKEDGKDQFFSYGFFSEDMPYDFGSVMHYDKFAFSRSTEKGYWTIRPQPEFEKQAALDSPTGAIGQRKAMSPKDLQKINTMYRCPERKQTTTTDAPTLIASIASIALLAPNTANEIPIASAAKIRRTKTTGAVQQLVTTEPPDYEDDPTEMTTSSTTTRRARGKGKKSRTLIADSTTVAITTPKRKRNSHSSTVPTTPELPEYYDDVTAPETTTKKSRKSGRTPTTATTLTTTVTSPTTTEQDWEWEDEPTEPPKMSYADEWKLAQQYSSEAQVFELKPGSSLEVGKSVWNPLRTVKLEVRPDGDAALVRLCDNATVWSTLTSNSADSAPHILTMQTDGNLVMRSSSGALLWSSDTAEPRFAGSSLRLGMGGGICLFKDDLCLWQSGGLGPCKPHLSAEFRTATVLLKSGGVLKYGHSLFNTRRRCKLQLQLDGDLVLKQMCDATENWSLRHGTGRALNLGVGDDDKVEQLVMTTQGNLVAHRTNSAPHFKINIPNAEGADLRISSSCHMCVFKDGACLWTSHAKTYSCP